eukprot:CAMPEP_0196728418 /NCGR_PEP_ID=MMETSP1091-20130531/9096_1 /TAXON_ID=302021 /ORGANISM="Rhodomonas sp., Strain CCMP768" /LENGTH=90 /DNA_ID=CAMNT_0042071157 /DNA_START=453 /DNA_END=725 /DNA_ORIENTATION=+
MEFEVLDDGVRVDEATQQSFRERDRAASPHYTTKPAGNVMKKMAAQGSGLAWGETHAAQGSKKVKRTPVTALAQETTDDVTNHVSDVSGA